MNIQKINSNAIKSNIYKNIRKVTFITALTTIGAMSTIKAQNNISQDTLQINKEEITSRNRDNHLLKRNTITTQAIQQALPFINNGIYKDVKINKNTMIIDDTYTLETTDGKSFKGINGFWENHSFSLENTPNGYNIIYRRENNKQVISFDKKNKIMDLCTAYKLNTDSTITKFNNPLSKEVLKSIATVIGKNIDGKVEYEDNNIKIKCPSEVLYYKHKKDLTFADEPDYLPVINNNYKKANSIKIEYNNDDDSYQIKLYKTSNKEEKIYKFDKHHNLINEYNTTNKRSYNK